MVRDICVLGSVQSLEILKMCLCQNYTRVFLIPYFYSLSFCFKCNWENIKLILMELTIVLDGRQFSKINHFNERV